MTSAETLINCVLRSTLIAIGPGGTLSRSIQIRHSQQRLGCWARQPLAQACRCCSGGKMTRCFVFAVISGGGSGAVGLETADAMAVLALKMATERLQAAVAAITRSRSQRIQAL